MYRLLLVCVLMVGCYKKIPMKGSPKGDSPPWCFEAIYDRDDKRVRVCYETPELCDGALEKVRKYGEIANVKHVTDCRIM